MTRTFLSNLIFVLRHIYVFEREKKGSIKLVKIIKLNNCRIHGILLKTIKKDTKEIYHCKWYSVQPNLFGSFGECQRELTCVILICPSLSLSVGKAPDNSFEDRLQIYG